jgi:hypothetical protein
MAPLRGAMLVLVVAFRIDRNPLGKIVDPIFLEPALAIFAFSHARNKNIAPGFDS